MSEAIDLSEQSGSVTPQPDDNDDGVQQEATPAVPGDEQYLSASAWNGLPNHVCPECGVGFLESQGGSAAVRNHIRQVHPGLARS